MPALKEHYHIRLCIAITPENNSTRALKGRDIITMGVAHRYK
jgi:hypothetical protein